MTGRVTRAILEAARGRLPPCSGGATVICFRRLPGSRLTITLWGFPLFPMQDQFWKR